MRLLELASGDRLPVLGQGTWHMGERRADRPAEVAALRRGLELGLGLIDTAEMYGDAESVVGEAIAGRRDDVFLVSKVLPHHATLRGTIEACEASLRRLGTDRIDLYLLHWRGNVPLAQTFEAFERLRADGKIRQFGVSNLDVADLDELWTLDTGRQTVTDQVLYNLTRRGPEADLLPWCRARGLPVMAYSPIEQGRLTRDPVLADLARRHDATPAQIAIAWVLHQQLVCAIPKAADPEHVEQNAAALDIALTEDELAELDRRFPAPEDPVPLEML